MNWKASIRLKLILTETTCGSYWLLGPNGEDGEPQPEQIGDDVNSPVLMYDATAIVNWLTGPDGGRKDSRTAQRHASQVKRIFVNLGVTNPARATDAMFDRQLIRDNFLKHMRCQRNIYLGLFCVI